MDRPTFVVGSSVYRRDRPMTYKGRVTSLFHSEQLQHWMAIVQFPDGAQRITVDRLIEVM
jgi:hypothetical protein